MVESMACGTPVVAYRRGAAPEVIVDGKTGFLVAPDDAARFAGAVDRVSEIEPVACRLHVQRKFSSTSLVEGYTAIYRRLFLRAANGPRTAARPRRGLVTDEAVS
jgi:glycosyltransferase involved in cell wall biosynthesis